MNYPGIILHMNTIPYPHATAFAGTRRIATGALDRVALKVKQAVDAQAQELLLVFDDSTGQSIDLDFRGSPVDFARRLAERFAPAAAEAGGGPRGPGRPRLGVVAREVTLLPRHWDWLASQPGGASVALRKLVEQARRAHEPEDRRRQAQEACYRFMSAMAGNERGFEEASRALFASDLSQFQLNTRGWPADVRAQATKLAAVAFTEIKSQPESAPH